jgi:hypothetical protein
MPFVRAINTQSAITHDKKCFRGVTMKKNLQERVDFIMQTVRYLRGAQIVVGN